MGCKSGNIDAAAALIDAGFDVTLMQTTEIPKGQWCQSMYYFGTAIKPDSAVQRKTNSIYSAC